MSMWLSDDLSVFHDDLRIVVAQGWNTSSLLDNEDLSSSQTEALVVLEQLESMALGIVGHHDTKRNSRSLVSHLAFDSLDILTVILDVGGSGCGLSRQSDLQQAND